MAAPRARDFHCSNGQLCFLIQAVPRYLLLLQGGGFGCVVMDLTDLPLPHVRSIPLASWFRFQRTIEKTPTVLVVMSPESAVKSAAALVLRTEMQAPNGRPS